MGKVNIHLKRSFLCSVGVIAALNLLMLGSAIFAHANIHYDEKMEDHIRSHFLDLLPLTNASQDDLKMLNNAQMQFQCCGVEQGYLDWKNNISQTCLCHNMSINPCVPAPKGSFQFTVEGPEDQPIMIYSKPCIPLIIEETYFYLNISSCIHAGFMILWMLPIGLCIAILCQINKKLETPEVVYSKEARAGKYSCLVETPDDYIA
ncbi:tetraspanin-8-like isoform X3 [Cyprinodon tularosa]|uniref:tetraspanin-8-like isoform X3 n=1 Tax=Cyprinodon tularosa TaxID=77115 RepID=UPI0018E22B3F|nr:tetraspanin-8-like isoform X3 [Cyprinodon tularosa]